MHRSGEYKFVFFNSEKRCILIDVDILTILPLRTLLNQLSKYDIQYTVTYYDAVNLTFHDFTDEHL